MSHILPLIRRITKNNHHENGDGRVEKFFVFKLNGKYYAIPAIDVAEVAMPMPLIDIPQKNDFLLGVVNIRGNVIPVIDFCPRMGIESKCQIDDNSRLLLFNIDSGSFIGMFTDEIEYRLREGIVEPLPADCDHRSKTSRTVVIGMDKYPVFMIDVYLGENEMRLLRSVADSF